MRSFLIKISIFSILVILPMYLLFSRADGNWDPFYERFTTPKQENLLLGTSRAAQGLQPAVFNEMLGKDFYNYSFTVVHSPYGPTYLKSIRRKLKSDTNSGTFILTVDPWSVSSISEDPNNLKDFRELAFCLENTPLVSIDPNPLYLLNNEHNYHRLFKRKKGSLFLHDDGWLEVSPPMDSSLVKERIENKVQDYREDMLPYYKFSEARLSYLVKTIEYLQTHGKVYLVRLPIHERMMQVENELTNDFDLKIAEAIKLSNGYLDLTDLNSSFSYTDGNHLYKTSGEKVSRIIANWVKQQRLKN